MSLSVSSNGSTWVKLVKYFLDITLKSTFSILERIDVGETGPGVLYFLSRPRLSVSSNGSTWVKLNARSGEENLLFTFSILERIDVGETLRRPIRPPPARTTFSILERIDVGETFMERAQVNAYRALSVSSNGSTWVKPVCLDEECGKGNLSVSSNGSTWVKRSLCKCRADAWPSFQYPRTDRRG